MVWNDRIQLCEPFAVRLDGERVDAGLSNPQVKRLFVWLALNRTRRATRSELMDAVWAKVLPPAADSALSALLSKIRRALGPSSLDGRSSVRLVLPPGTWVDVDAGLDAAHRARGLLYKQEWTEALMCSRIAMEVGKRPLLPGEEGVWLDERREALTEMLLQAHECHIEADLGIGGSEIDDAVMCARQLVKLAPFRENGHRLLMEALSAEGNIAEALRAFETLRALLRDELGASPGPAVRAVHLRLLKEQA